MHFVFEGTDLQFFEEGGLTGGDFFTFGDDLNGVDDFDLGFDDLGLDVKGLEELGLLGVHTGGTSVDGHIDGGEGTNLSGSLTLLEVNDRLNLTEIAISEDETNVENESVVNDLEVRTRFILLLILALKISDGFSHQGVLSHDHNSANFSERFTHDADLLGGDVVSVDKEALGVLGAGGLSLFPHFVFSFLLLVRTGE